MRFAIIGNLVVELSYCGWFDSTMSAPAFAEMSRIFRAEFA